MSRRKLAALEALAAHPSAAPGERANAAAAAARLRAATRVGEPALPAWVQRLQRSEVAGSDVPPPWLEIALSIGEEPPRKPPAPRRTPRQRRKARPATYHSRGRWHG